MIDTVVQPDICVVCDSSKLDYRGCCGAPDMIVEILSPSTAKRDLNEKFDLYEESGVKEYWIVYPFDREIHVFLLQETGKYGESIVFERKGQIPVHMIIRVRHQALEQFLKVKKRRSKCINHILQNSLRTIQ